jgi:hypothetical protein
MSPSYGHLRERFEHLAFIIHKLSEQSCTVLLLISSTYNSPELRALSHNLNTLTSQLKTTLTIYNIYNQQYKQFLNIPYLLPKTDLHSLFSNLKFHSERLWKLLSFPLLAHTRHTTIQFITLLDTFTTQYIIPHLSLPGDYLQSFSQPSIYCKPSVIQQVSTTEISVDPYILSLQKNYYYPLSTSLEVTENMDIDGTNSQGQQQPADHSQPNNQGRKTITVEDSMDAIDELIQEIQSGDQIIMEQPDTMVSPQITNLTRPSTTTLRFSLSKKGQFIATSPNNLSILKQFFHCILSIGSLKILPIRNDNPITPIKTMAQINELNSVGAKAFFKPSKA